MTASVPNGSSIQWRYKSSDTSGDWSGLSYVTDSDMNSSTVDVHSLLELRVYLNHSVHVLVSKHQHFQLRTVINTVFKVEYKIDSGSYTTVHVKSSTAASTTNNSTFTQSVSDGTTITWRVTGSDTSGDFTGSYTSAVTSLQLIVHIVIEYISIFGTCSASGSSTHQLYYYKQ